MDKGYKVIRVITVAPVLALIMVGLVAGNCEGVFLSPWHLAYSMFFLGILPLLAYPLQKYIPAYRDKGREGQRNLAILFAAAGFVAGCMMSFVLPASDGLRVIFLEYVCGRRPAQGLRLWLFSRFFLTAAQVKNSGGDSRESHQQSGRRREKVSCGHLQYNDRKHKGYAFQGIIL